MAKKEMTFEAALAELQTVVSALEEGKVGLDESLGLFERGMELVRVCNQRIDQAEQRVLAVNVTKEGVVTTEPFPTEGN